ncbi:hypothetical protein BJ878DRAFT_216897 [Calycina marina]|uniref:Uncharacterized protein n=1 Tax=Calycina marina TaxID=1763456 RepID=A0A9P8CHD3_9HELO|nr:hypothetical protein BJ878DRAFT_216897 [Calycina marina]
MLSVWAVNDPIVLDSAREGVSEDYATPVPDITILPSVIAFGDIVSAVGAEVFTRIGWRIKSESPLRKTMRVTLANGKSLSCFIGDSLSINQTCFQMLGAVCIREFVRRWI